MTGKQRSDAPQRVARKNPMRRTVSYPGVASTQEREAMDLALAHLTEQSIKPRLTLKEFADLYQMDLRQVQSDAERAFLPLAPRTNPNRRELLQVNMVAYYARMYLDGFSHLDKETTF